MLVFTHPNAWSFSLPRQVVFHLSQIVPINKRNFSTKSKKSKCSEQIKAKCSDQGEEPSSPSHASVVDALVPFRSLWDSEVLD